MKAITDELMRKMLATSKDYSVVVLKATRKRKDLGADKIVMEHGRRNMALYEDGVLPVICRITDGSGVSGVGIFNATPEEVRKIMDEDPGVRAGIFTYEIHACRSFPGACLPR
jgi:hypothetical protein